MLAFKTSRRSQFFFGEKGISSTVLANPGLSGDGQGMESRRVSLASRMWNPVGHRPAREVLLEGQKRVELDTVTLEGGIKIREGSENVWNIFGKR